MKRRLIDRLDLLAEMGEAKWLREIARHSRALEQVTKQRRLLAAYREKLWGSWRNGSVVDAAAAKRAADFIAASQTAELQIEQMERQATQQLDLARQGFARTQEQRRSLDEKRRDAAEAAERTTAQRLERAQVLRPAKPLLPGKPRGSASNEPLRQHRPSAQGT